MKNTAKKTKLYQKKPILLMVLVYISLGTLTAQQKSSTDVLDKTKVCMVNDEYKGEQQLITIIDEKIYYGCCDPCIEALNTDSSFRYAIDPFSGLKISKAEAFIAKKENNSDAVIYFENEENYRQYINKSNR